MLSSGPRTIETGTGSMSLTSNAVSTRKYSWASFLPVSLLFQFRSVSNAYFLLTATIMLIPNVSPISPISAIAPLCFVLFVSEVREFVEEYQKNRRDVQTNTTPIRRLRRASPDDAHKITFEHVTWEALHPGDLVLLNDRDKIPADLCIASSAANNYCYVETSNLDGETNLKTREAPQALQGVVTLLPGRSGEEPEHFDFSALFDHKLVFEPPNPDMYRFKGSFNTSSSKTTLSINNIMLRGCSMRNTPWAVGICVYTGHETKAMLNTASAGVVPSKKTNVERRMNIMVLIVFGCQVLLILGATLGYQACRSSFGAWYLDNVDDMSAGLVALTFFVLLNTIIPMSLWVSLEVLKFLQASLMEADAAMKDPERGLSCVAHSKNLNEELGQVTHVFTDKTGTLTCNRMEFKGCAINGHIYTVEESVIDEANELSAGNATIRAAGGDVLEPNLVQLPPSVGGPPPIVKRRDLGFAGAIPISDGLLEVIRSKLETCTVESPEADFFKCIALCHSCERVQRHPDTHTELKPARRRRSSLLTGWFSPKKEGEGVDSVAGEVVAEAEVEKSRKRLQRNIGVSTVYPTIWNNNANDKDEGGLGEDEVGPQTPGAGAPGVGEGMNIPRKSSVLSLRTPGGLDSIDEKLQLYKYQSTSPDEAALVCSAADVGFVFHKRLPSAVQVDLGGQAYVYEILHQIAFTSDRRMMSVVVRLAEVGGVRVDGGEVVCFTKGADSSVIPICLAPAQDGESSVIPHTEWAVEAFADKGFRTLCLAKREMTVSEWSEFESRIKSASADLDTRDALVALIDKEIETKMTLLGCTAVEDKLQPGVHETVAALRTAGIAVCMITGDKRETAINIARSCKLVNSEHNVYTMSTQDNMYGGGNFIHLDSLMQLVGDGRADPLWGMTTEGHDATTAAAPAAAGRRTSLEPPVRDIELGTERGSMVSLSPLATEARLAAITSGRSGMMPRMSLSDSLSSETRGVPHRQSEARSGGSSVASHLRKDNNKFCIVLDGAALSILLANPSQTKKLLSVMAHPQCEAAVFCRVNPKQKGLIVKSCRNRLAAGCVLAIGDGANDISMIKEAHVGVGIYGEEGWQAAGSADYAITRFKDLYRLLFIHGRWNYARITLFITFFMYKNFAFTFLQFWMAVVSQWTGLSVLDSYCLLLFNSIFMVGPLFTAGLFDKDIHPDADRPSKRTMLHPANMDDKRWYVNVVPKLYSPGQKNELFKSERVVAWLLLGLIHSVVIFFGIFLSWAFFAGRAIESSGFNTSFEMDSQALYTALLMAMSGLHSMLVKEWSYIYWFGNIVVHVALYVGFCAVYDKLFIQPYGYIAGSTFSNWNFWFTFTITLAMCIVPVVAFRSLKKIRNPSLMDAIKSKHISKTDRAKYAERLGSIRGDPSELTGV